MSSDDINQLAGRSYRSPPERCRECNGSGIVGQLEAPSTPCPPTFAKMRCPVCQSPPPSLPAGWSWADGALPVLASAVGPCGAWAAVTKTILGYRLTTGHAIPCEVAIAIIHRAEDV